MWPRKKKTNHFQCILHKSHKREMNIKTTGIHFFFTWYKRSCRIGWKCSGWNFIEDCYWDWWTIAESVQNISINKQFIGFDTLKLSSIRNNSNKKKKNTHIISNSREWHNGAIGLLNILLCIKGKKTRANATEMLMIFFYSVRFIFITCPIWMWATRFIAFLDFATQIISEYN